MKDVAHTLTKGTVMGKRQYTPTELGMMYGLLIGAVIFLTMFSLTGEIMWILAMGTGIALGLGIGSSMEQRKG